MCGVSAETVLGDAARMRAVKATNKPANARIGLATLRHIEATRLPSFATAFRNPETSKQSSGVYHAHRRYIDHGNLIGNSQIIQSQRSFSLFFINLKWGFYSDPAAEDYVLARR